MTPSPENSRRWRYALGGVLVASAALRLALVHAGGTGFWPGEAWLPGLLGLAPDSVALALVLAAVSVVNLALVARVARALGAGPREAVFAAGFMAVTATQFYLVRHNFPYDLALTCGLLGMLAGWDRATERDTFVRSAGTGVLAGLGFVLHAGSAGFGAVVVAGHVLFAWPDARRGVRRALPAVAGFGLLAALRMAVPGGAPSMPPGGADSAWAVLTGYLWAAEGFNAVLGAAGLLAALAWAAAAGQWTRGATWTAAGAGILAWTLAAPVVGFAVDGATARLVVPFACLAGAGVLERGWRLGGGGARAAALLTGFVLAQGLANLWSPLTLVFPAEFNRRAVEVRQQRKAQGDGRQLAVIQAERLDRPEALVGRLPDHDELLREPHPLAYRPYQYDGSGAAVREAWAGADLGMRLVAVNRGRFDHPVALRRPYPGAVRLTLQLPELRVAGVAEPLLITGETGRGDLIYLVYQNDASIRLGFDHWGVGGFLSDPVSVNPARPVVVTLSTGPLHDPAAGSDGVDPRHWLYAAVDGRVVWSRREAFHPAKPESITLLANPIGGSTAGAKFTGRLKRVESLLIPPFAGP